jgi:hypothetical protein
MVVRNKVQEKGAYCANCGVSFRHHDATLSIAHSLADCAHVTLMRRPRDNRASATVARSLAARDLPLGAVRPANRAGS